MDQPFDRSFNPVNSYAQVIANELGWEATRCELLEQAAVLHDIGKLFIPNAILHKPSPLTDEEWTQMRRHPEMGAIMLEGAKHLPEVVRVVLYHHENWDGSGYPEGLRGDEIPEEARVLAVVNAFDVMTSDQPYRTASSADGAHAEILMQAGSQFDPNIVKAFNQCWERGEIQEILIRVRGQ